MRARCKYPSHAAWKWYGGKGITVCDRWQTYENFEADMGERPEGKTLDRIDANGPYSPENCRWVTPKEQVRNQDRTIRVVIEGKSHLLIELAEISGLKADTVAARVAKGLSYAEVIDSKRRQAPARLKGILAHNRAMAEATHCKRGHEYTPENTDWRGHNRGCRECRLAVQARYKARKKAARQTSVRIRGQRRLSNTKSRPGRRLGRRDEWC